MRHWLRYFGGLRADTRMQLTRFTDYALRTLLYLGSHPDEVIPASAISQAFDISPDHLAKAAKWLTQRGYVRAARGAAGGLTLAHAPSSICIGALVRESEPHAGVLECFEPEVDTCKLSASCLLKRALAEATRAFFEVLDGYTLADLLANREQLVQLLPRVGRR